MVSVSSIARVVASSASPSSFLAPARMTGRAAVALMSLLVLAAAGLMLLPAPVRAAVDVQTVTSDKGLTAFLVSDDTLPIVTLEFMIPAGAAYDPDDKSGLATLVSGLLDEGAGPYDSLAFQTKLEDLAISLSFDAGQEMFSGSLKTLKENVGEAFELLHLALTQPRFDEEPVERIRAQVLAGLRRDQGDPNFLARRAWSEAVFGDHPYARNTEGTPESVAALTRQDLVDWTKTHLGRGTIHIGVAGDISADALSALLDKTFGDLPVDPALAPLPAPSPVYDGGTTVIPMEIPQSVAVIGQAGIPREHPDWRIAYTINYILGGGGFSSRLMEEVREKRGLAYSAYSYIYPLGETGVWMGGTATRNEKMGESLSVIRDEWRRMAENGPTADELETAKTYLLGAWPLQFTNTGSIAGMLAAMRRWDLPADYIQTRNAEVEAITLDDVRRVARDLMTPDNLTAVVVGQPEGLDGDEAKGEVN